MWKGVTLSFAMSMVVCGIAFGAADVSGTWAGSTFYMVLKQEGTKLSGTGGPAPTEQIQMQDTLRVGDEVITAGGIRGYVRQLDEEVLKVEIAPEVVVRLDRRAVAAVVQEEDDDPDELTQTESGES